MVIRRGAPGDASALAALAERTFRDTFAADNNAADMDAYCATAYAPEIQARQLADDDIDTLLVEADGVLIGYFQLRPGALPVAIDDKILSPPVALSGHLPHLPPPPRMSPPPPDLPRMSPSAPDLPRTSPHPPDLPRTIELWRFYVERAQHGRGVAASLMDAAIAAARLRGAGTMWLGVWERNYRAQAFYRKAGFVDVGAQQFVLGTDVQTDRVMACNLVSLVATSSNA